jgi:acyl carrier protein
MTVTTFEKRLLLCFRAVFGELPDEELLRASISSMEQWDSIATVTLSQVIEEEFQIPFDFELVGELSSFETIAKYLHSASDRHHSFFVSGSI